MNDNMRDRREIARQANHWLTRRDTGLMTPEDEIALRDWLANSHLHVEAYRRAQSIFNAIVIAADPVNRTISKPRVPGRRRSGRWTAGKPRRTVWFGGAVAASFAAFAVIATDLPVRMQADAIAATGEIKRVNLPDGSIALLDSGAAIAFDFGAERRIALLRGQAAFTVAADTARPFVVEARGGATTALGTRFIVNRIGSATRVTVTEHSVRVSYLTSVLDVSEGNSALYDEHGISVPHRKHLAEADAWTRGRVRFVNRPLREVVAELGRYHRGYIGIVGGKLGGMPVNGVFYTGDPVGALDTIQRSLGLASYRIGDRLILLHR